MRGVSSAPMIVLGTIYILEIIESEPQLLSEDYPWSMVSCPACWISEYLSKDDEWIKTK